MENYVLKKNSLLKIIFLQDEAKNISTVYYIPKHSIQCAQIPGQVQNSRPIFLYPRKQNQEVKKYYVAALSPNIDISSPNFGRKLFEGDKFLAARVILRVLRMNKKYT
jgi:hypothetical protein